MRSAPRRATISGVVRSVLIVDTSSERRALLETDGLEVVGEAADGESTIAEAERLQPELSCSTSSFRTSMGSRSDPAGRQRHVDHAHRRVRQNLRLLTRLDKAKPRAID